MIKKIKVLMSNTHFLKYFKNTSWLFAEKILRMAVGLFVGVWMTRYLGPERYGLLSYAQSFTSLFSSLASLGIDGVLLRKLIKYPYKEKELIGTAFLLKLTGSFLFLFILNVVTILISKDNSTRILIAIVGSAIICQSFNVIDLYFQSKVLSKYVVFANSLSLLCSSILKVILILLNAPLIAFAWTFLFDGTVLILGFLYFFIKISNFNIKYIKFNTNLGISLIKDGFFYMLSAIIISLYMRIDQVMIKEILNEKSVGYYAVAARISELWYFIPILISKSLYPAIESAKKYSLKIYYDRLEKIFVICYLLSLLIVLPTFFLSDYIIITLYGDSYEVAGSILKIHTISLVFAFQRVASEYWVLSQNARFFELVKTGLGVFSNVILNIFLIKIYGIRGAAIATVISMSITSYFSYALYKKSRIIFRLMTKTLFLSNLKCLRININERNI